jgi:hypothetical protein
MSKKLTSEDKKKFIDTSLVKLTDGQKKIVLETSNLDAQYDKVRRYLRLLSDSHKQEKQLLLDLATKYRTILDGLDCIDNRLWTDEKKIKSFSDMLEGYCDKCIKLVEDNNRKHLERLKLQREQLKKKYDTEQAQLDKEIAEFENKMK